MANIDIKLSQKTVDQLNRIDDGTDASLSDLFGTIIESSSYISRSFSSASSWSSSGNTVSLKFDGGATLTYTGTVYPDYLGAYTGKAVASSRVINAPKYFKESITGTFYYDYYASRTYLSYTPTGIGTYNTYQLESFQSEPDFGKGSFSLTGDISINSLNKAIYGTLSNLTVTASEVGKGEINGIFTVSSNYDYPDRSSVTGTLTQYKMTYKDGSYTKITGSLDIKADTILDESVIADENNFSGADTINIVLPSRIYSDFIVNSGQGNDIISAGGGGGKHIIYSGQGDDEITLLDASPVINGGDGDDTVKSSAISLDLRSYIDIENITLMGTKAINATGNGYVNILRGNSAANVLDGQGGADILEGAAGNDTYIIYGAGETIIDTSGIDLVRSYATWTLASVLENLTLMDSANINGTGNALANTITGNSGNNVLFGNAGIDVLVGGAGNDTLDGGIGADAMTGGAGNDIYVVNDAKDTITEKTNEGTDTIQTSLASYSLAKLAAVENIAYTGTVNATLTGNALVNTLTGSSGNDTLNGGADSDSMNGGSGNDTYIVDNVGDAITEIDNGGTDSVRSSVSYILSDCIENLTLTGKAAIDGTGNNQNNTLTGNTAANTLSGGQGNDTLDGGAGNDTLVGGDGIDLLIGGLGNDLLTGGKGADKFRFEKALGKTNIDTITDFASGTDCIELDDAIFKKFIGVTGQIAAGNLVKGGDGVVALQADDYLVLNTRTGVLFYDPDGGGRGAMIQFATLTGVNDLTSNDFLVV